MATVTPVPFAIALIVGLALFATCTYLLIQQESRHPVQVRAATGRATTTSAPHLSHTRVAAICVLFALWSVWVTARPVSGWR